MVLLTLWIRLLCSSDLLKKLPMSLTLTEPSMQRPTQSWYSSRSGSRSQKILKASHTVSWHTETHINASWSPEHEEERVPVMCWVVRFKVLTNSTIISKWTQLFSPNKSVNIYINTSLKGNTGDVTDKLPVTVLHSELNELFIADQR